MISAGIDAGSRTIKVVLWDAAAGRILGAGIADQGVRQQALVAGLFQRVLRRAGVGRRRVGRVTATGWGRDGVAFADAAVTEITCQARGVRQLHPGARTVVDIGGQDCKFLRLDAEGAVQDFVMSDRCAAGTGRFLEVLAARLEIPLGRLGDPAARPAKPAAINSTCVVFAETEIIGLMAFGERPEAIAAGVRQAVARRIAAMAGRQVVRPVLFTGGVALVPGMARALAAALGHPVTVARRAQLTAALGAALFGVRPAPAPPAPKTPAKNRADKRSHPARQDPASDNGVDRAGG